jgi:hypothetical protein
VKVIGAAYCTLPGRYGFVLVYDAELAQSSVMRLTPAQLCAAGVTVGAVAAIAGCTVHETHRPTVPSVGVNAGAATVTGFTWVPRGIVSSGRRPVPVNVDVSARRASALEGVAFALPRSDESVCYGGGGHLIYRITSARGGLDGVRTVISGYICGGLVDIHEAGSPPSWRRDASCTLLAAVRQSLPARAAATQTFDVGCNRPDGLSD